MFSLTSMIIHHVGDAEHVPFFSELLNQSPHILPAVPLTLWAELRVDR